MSEVVISFKKSVDGSLRNQSQYYDVPARMRKVGREQLEKFFQSCVPADATDVKIRFVGFPD